MALEDEYSPNNNKLGRADSPAERKREPSPVPSLVGSPSRRNSPRPPTDSGSEAVPKVVPPKRLETIPLHAGNSYSNPLSLERLAQNSAVHERIERLIDIQKHCFAQEKTEKDLKQDVEVFSEFDDDEGEDGPFPESIVRTKCEAVGLSERQDAIIKQETEYTNKLVNLYKKWERLIMNSEIVDSPPALLKGILHILKVLRKQQVEFRQLTGFESPVNLINCVSKVLNFRCHANKDLAMKMAIVSYEYQKNIAILSRLHREEIELWEKHRQMVKEVDLLKNMVGDVEEELMRLKLRGALDKTKMQRVPMRCPPHPLPFTEEELQQEVDFDEIQKEKEQELHRLRHSSRSPSKNGTRKFTNKAPDSARQVSVKCYKPKAIQNPVIKAPGGDKRALTISPRSAFTPTPFHKQLMAQQNSTPESGAHAKHSIASLSDPTLAMAGKGSDLDQTLEKAEACGGTAAVSSSNNANSKSSS